MCMCPAEYYILFRVEIRAIAGFKSIDDREGYCLSGHTCIQVDEYDAVCGVFGVGDDESACVETGVYASCYLCGIGIALQETFNGTKVLYESRKR